MSVAGFVREKTLNAREEGDRERSYAWKQVASVGTGMNGRGVDRPLGREDPLEKDGSPLQIKYLLGRFLWCLLEVRQVYSGSWKEEGTLSIYLLLGMTL